MTGSLADRFKSGSQKAGNVTEAWGAENFYCPNCSSPKLDWLKPGTKASDYHCSHCGFWYQLKSKKSPIGKSITDGAYGAMMEAIQEDRAPNYFFLHYDLATWSVRNLLLVPSFAFPLSAIVKRPPLAATARRAGWVGCNFDLSRVPADARIDLVRTIASSSPPSPTGERIRGEVGQLKSPHSGSLPAQSRGERVVIVSPSEVRAQFHKVKPLKELSVKERGWTLDVLNIVRRIVECGGTTPLSPDATCRVEPKRGHVRALQNEFTNEDVYDHACELEKLHPDNRHVRDKIRQQLQVLRDAKLLIHVSAGVWRLP